jgi:hypothetical protein
MTTLKIDPNLHRRHSGNYPESVRSDSLIMGKAQTNANHYVVILDSDPESVRSNSLIEG